MTKSGSCAGVRIKSGRTESTDLYKMAMLQIGVLLPTAVDVFPF